MFKVINRDGKVICTTDSIIHARLYTLTFDGSWISDGSGNEVDTLDWEDEE